ncbi:hypothetical protein DS6A_57 [Mycobacterium phage DS6A]|uniref:Uncharacterized protein n=1 Tax=Mycobacterium phage DS6A TaxID=45764 RepID=G8I4G7_9CAUD|nr:hypothetical protein DS6A_57 [Mycobacterium phage DS6A]AER47611.1 hypothetical protein DS6A_57 [Mycobacterium phage DS6A]
MMERYLPAVLAAACFIVWWRRTTWPYLWEQAANFNLVCIAVSLVLLSPQMAPAFTWAAAWAGNNIEDLLGMFVHLIGLAVFAGNLIARVDFPNNAELTRFISTRVSAPVTLALPILAALFTAGGVPPEPADTILGGPGLLRSSGASALFAVGYGAAVIYIDALIVWALLIIRADPASARTTTVYFAVAAVSASWGALLIVEVVTGWDLTDLLWLLICATAGGYIAAGWAGMCRIRRWLRPFQMPPGIGVD